MTLAERFLELMLVVGPSPHPARFNKHTPPEVKIGWTQWRLRARAWWFDRYYSLSFPIEAFEAWQLRQERELTRRVIGENDETCIRNNETHARNNEAHRRSDAGTAGTADVGE